MDEICYFEAFIKGILPSKHSLRQFPLAVLEAGPFDSLPHRKRLGPQLREKQYRLFRPTAHGRRAMIPRGCRRMSLWPTRPRVPVQRRAASGPPTPSSFPSPNSSFFIWTRPSAPALFGGAKAPRASHPLAAPGARGSERPGAREPGTRPTIPQRAPAEGAREMDANRRSRSRTCEKPNPLGNLGGAGAGSLRMAFPAATNSQHRGSSQDELGGRRESRHTCHARRAENRRIAARNPRNHTDARVNAPAWTLWRGLISHGSGILF